MTIIVEPSSARGEANHNVVSSIAGWGRTDWIAPTGLAVNAGRHGLTGTPLNGAAVTTSGLDVSIDTFEAFVGGAWLASDDNTHASHTHTLAGSSTVTTLYLGYDLGAADTFIFGPSGSFGGNDPKVPVVNVEDDGTSVTKEWDRRPLGPAPELGVLVDAEFDGDNTSPLTFDTTTLAQTYPAYRLAIYRESHQSAELYQTLRLNGISSSSYRYDVFNAADNTFSSASGTAFGKIAGTDQADSNHTGWCLQVLDIKCPPEIVAHAQHYPIIEPVEKGVGMNVDHIHNGHLLSDVQAVDRVELSGGGDATGWVALYGASRIAGL